MYQIAKKNLPALFQRIAEEQELYLPVKVSNQVNFAAWDKDAEVDLDTLKTVKSQKMLFFHRVKICIQYKKKERNFPLSQKH